MTYQTKINSKWIFDLNLRAEIMKILTGSNSIKFYSSWESRVFFNIHKNTNYKRKKLNSCS